MQFPTPAFCIFILAMLPAWYAFASRPLARAWIGLAFGLAFLAASGATSAVAAFAYALFAMAIGRHAQKFSKSTYFAAIAAMLAPLIYFKYSAWLSSMLGLDTRWMWTASAPLGLSFYTFSCLAWILALRAGQTCPSATQCVSAAFSPAALAAGPVLRPEDAAIEWSRPIDPPRFCDAAAPFLLGFALKLAVSARLGQIADPIFANPAGQGFWNIALAIHAYSGQIYADFAGYSLMAIGVGKALGAQLPSNFEAPYAAVSVADFWRRWHMSLSRFWRENIYFPLGGNRAGRLREAANLMAVMLLCGLWHGAGAAFVAWGAIHGSMLCAGRAWAWAGLPKIPKILAWAMCFEAVTWAWMPFRINDFDTLQAAVAELTRFETEFHLPSLTFAACFFAIAAEHVWKADILAWSLKLGKERSGLFLAVAVAVAIAAIELAPEGIPPFIYANF